MNMTPKSVTINVGIPAAVKNLRIELFNADHSTLLNTLGVGPSPGGVYPFVVDVGTNGDASGKLFNGVSAGASCAIRVVETAWDNSELPTAFVGVTVNPLPDGPPTFSVQV